MPFELLKIAYEWAIEKQNASIEVSTNKDGCEKIWIYDYNKMAGFYLFISNKVTKEGQEVKCADDINKVIEGKLKVQRRERYEKLKEEFEGEGE